MSQMLRDHARVVDALDSGSNANDEKDYAVGEAFFRLHEEKPSSFDLIDLARDNLGLSPTRERLAAFCNAVLAGAERADKDLATVRTCARREARRVFERDGARTKTGELFEVAPMAAAMMSAAELGRRVVREEELAFHMAFSDRLAALEELAKGE